MGPPGDLSGPRARNVRPGPPSGLALGAVLGASWAILEASGAVLGPSVAVLGPSWRPIGPCWGELGGLLDRLGAAVSRKGENVKITEKRIENHQFLPPGALLGGLLKGSWGVLKAPRAVRRPSWASWTARSVTKSPLGSSWGPLGALLARSGGRGRPHPGGKPSPRGCLA